MRKRELRLVIPTLKGWELDKLEELYRQTGQDTRRELVLDEKERRQGKKDGQLVMAT